MVVLLLIYVDTESNTQNKSRMKQFKLLLTINQLNVIKETHIFVQREDQFLF